MGVSDLRILYRVNLDLPLADIAFRSVIGVATHPLECQMSEGMLGIGYDTGVSGVEAFYCQAFILTASIRDDPERKN
jgi:hypothetical protein